MFDFITSEWWIATLLGIILGFIVTSIFGGIVWFFFKRPNQKISDEKLDNVLAA